MGKLPVNLYIICCRGISQQQSYSFINDFQYTVNSDGVSIINRYITFQILSKVFIVNVTSRDTRLAFKGANKIDHWHVGGTKNVLTCKKNYRFLDKTDHAVSFFSKYTKNGDEIKYREIEFDLNSLDTASKIISNSMYFKT